MSTIRTRRIKAIATLAIGMLLAGVSASTAVAVDDTEECVASPGQDYIAPTYGQVVDVEGWTETIPGSWWNWSPNNSQGPQDYTPIFPTDARGTWQGPHDEGGPDQEEEGTYNESHGNSGNSSWFHRGAPQVIVHETTYKEGVIDPGQPYIAPVVCEDPDPVSVSMNLTYMTDCAPDLTNTWRVRNSSDMDVAYTLEYAGQGVVASGVAPVGDSFVNLPRTSATAILKWGGGDSGIVAGSKTKASGVDGDACAVEEQFVTIIWNMNPVGAPPVFDPAQTIVDHKVTSTPELDAFDNLLTGDCAGFQVDVYKYTEAGDKAAVDNLISVGVLTAPGNPPEPLIEGGEGIAWKFYQDATCPQEPEVVAPEFPELIAPQCDTDGSLPTLPAETASITYTWDDSNPNIMIATAKSGFVFAGDKAEATHEYGAPASATGYQSEDPQAPCYVEVTDKTVSADPPTVVPMCGPNNDTVTAANTEGVSYSVGEWNNGELIVTATASNGYELVGDTSFTVMDDNVACPEGVTDAAVSADPPTVVPMCGPNNDTVTAATTEGVTYTVGTWSGNELIVTATANEGYEILGDTSFTVTDDNVACPEGITEVAPTDPTVVPVCGPNNDTVTATNTEAVSYTVGTWSGNKLTVTATANEGFSLTGDTSWEYTDTPVAGCPDEGPVFSHTPDGGELAFTGAPSNTNGLVALALFLMASGTALVARTAHRARS